MPVYRKLSRIWSNLRRRDRLEADLDAELRAYVDLSAGQKERSGMSPAEARRAALVESEGVEQVKERVRDVRAGALVELALRDIRFGARLLRKNPGFTATAVAMLALGIGANTAVFSVVNSVLLRGLPYAEPERIVAVAEVRPREGNSRNWVSVPDFLDWRQQSTSFESMAAIAHNSVTWQSPAGAEQVLAGVVSPEFFDVVGVRPAVGAGFRKESEIHDRYDAVVLTHGFWERRFGGDPGVLGSAITINGRPREVAGILPASFEYPVHDVELFVPLWWNARENLNRASHDLNVAGRLKRGVSIQAARAEMTAIAARLEQQYPEANKGHGVELVAMRDVLIGPMRSPLMTLQIAVGLVLLIACANLANLLLARMLARKRELSVRLAIGAGRRRLVSQLLCESVMLSLIGGAAGVLVAYAAVPLLQSLAPQDLPLLGIRGAQVDAPVLGVCMLLSVCCGLIFGLAPAWRGSGAGIAEALKDGAAGGGPGGDRLRKLLITGQIALSVVLLAGAGLWLRSFAALRGVDPGFRAAGVLTMRVMIPGSRYKEPEQVVRFTQEWMDEIRRLPGVQAVGYTSHLPVSGMDSRTGLVIEGVPKADPNVPRRAHVRNVSPGYFQAMGMRMVQGRPFLETDRAGAQRVMIVNEAAARMYFPNGKAVGHRGRRGGNDGPWFEVVGVVANVRHWGLDVEAKPEQYYCTLQEPSWSANLAIRTTGDPMKLASSVRQMLRSKDAQIPPVGVQTMEQVVARSVVSERSIVVLLGLFAVIALMLTAAGIWGTMAYLLSQRRREIGIRLALGATDRSLIRSAVVSAMRLAAAGLALGVVASIMLARVTATKLFGVSADDPWTYCGVAVVLAIVAWLANYYPARRITRSTPYTVLRQD